jgi:dihydrofolate reductase
MRVIAAIPKPPTRPHHAPIVSRRDRPLLQGDVAAALVALKQKQGANLHVIGSAELVQTLIEQGLVDEFRLMIDPLLLGGGKRIFGTDGALRPLRLVHSQVTTTGAILATYAAADHDRPGHDR